MHCLTLTYTRFCAGRTAGVAPPGECTLEGGVLAWYEIKKLELKPSFDPLGMAAYSTYGPNNEYWVGYDTPETLTKKVGLSSLHLLPWLLQHTSKSSQHWQ